MQSRGQTGTELAGLSREALLNRARDHIFSMGPADSGTRLCMANMVYGLAKIHCVQDQLGLPARPPHRLLQLSMMRSSAPLKSTFGAHPIVCFIRSRLGTRRIISSIGRP